MQICNNSKCEAGFLMKTFLGESKKRPCLSLALIPVQNTPSLTETLAAQACFYPHKCVKKSERHYTQIRFENETGLNSKEMAGGFDGTFNPELLTQPFSFQDDCQHAKQPFDIQF